MFWPALVCLGSQAFDKLSVRLPRPDTLSSPVVGCRARAHVELDSYLTLVAMVSERALLLEFARASSLLN